MMAEAAADEAPENPAADATGEADDAGGAVIAPPELPPEAWSAIADAVQDFKQRCLLRCVCRAARPLDVSMPIDRESKYSVYHTRKGLGDAMAAGIAALVPLARNQKLLYLELWGNHIGRTGAAALGLALEANPPLQQLDLRGNALGDEGATALSQGLRPNARLQCLRLDENAISCAGAGAIGAALISSQSSGLRGLGLGKNLVGDEGAELLSAALLGHNPRLGDTGAARSGSLGGCNWYNGTVTEVRSDGRFDICYDDGDTEQAVPPEFVKVGSSSGAGRPPAKRKAAGGGKAAADKGAGRANGVGGSSAAGQKRKLSKVDEADWLESRFSPLAAESSKLARGVADAFAELPPEEQARLLPLLPECDRDPAALQRAMRSEQQQQLASGEYDPACAEMVRARRSAAERKAKRAQDLGRERLRQAFHFTVAQLALYKTLILTIARKMYLSAVPSRGRSCDPAE
ncbi:hypothetical protein EMIHUDRAFT_229503 [Emiliania huxleyi CCMP1516]|uniref:Uncharacterized protein n=2 Tax=Emiliania huxleyi TaxID=2903 RepID=A0A0D3KCT7_EMIH1|nr:hypothetical protein EMIHUDRAFT_229503 [Emiliania huxleyi CCMP1516]EOD33572.1 hypothetical protein EMIHUDRAFT_229503 [Emiliania huxleyi CCMP1516]|eukprot:XP_005786001.1 hypothetical protein EMIHUDRAFT_229503 [Emiliania huxleyi CCMP1516]